MPPDRDSARPPGFLARAVALLATSLGAMLVGWVAWRSWLHRPTQTVVFADTSRQLNELLRRREAERPPDFVPRREPIPIEDAALLYPQINFTGGRWVFDPVAGFWEAGDYSNEITFPEHPAGGWTGRTNGLGFRKDVEVRDPAPDLRILVTGDSHIDGVVPVQESATEVLQRLLADRRPGRSVEVLNAAKGGFSFFNYLGVLEKFRALEPDVFVVVVYGGNDFGEARKVQRYHLRLPPERGLSPDRAKQLREVAAGRVAFMAQYGNQVALLAGRPDEQEFAVQAAVAATTEMARLCREAGIAFVCAYLPSMADVQPGPIQGELDGLLRVMDLGPEDLAVGRELGGRWRQGVGEAGIDVLDLTGFLRAPPACYWVDDEHLNTEGHRRVAAALAAALQGR